MSFRAKIFKKKEGILFFVGPEAGFSSLETKILRKIGMGVRLHQNILRTDTAPLAALSQIAAAII